MLSSESELSYSFEELPLSHVFMFGEVMRIPKICQAFLEALLNKKIRRIVYINKEQEVSFSAFQHGIRMDIYLEDAENTVYCVEMQRYGEHYYILRRARYYQGAMDTSRLKPGMHYSQLPQSLIVFVCDFDPFHRGLALYRRKSVLEGCEDVVCDDGTQLIILNSRYTEPNADPVILEFLDCIRENNTETDHYQSELMHSVCTAIHKIRQNDEKRGAFMTFETLLSDIQWESEKKGREEGRAEGEKKGRAEGREEGRAEGEKKGRAEGGLSMLGRMLDAGAITLRSAAEFAGLDENSFLAQLREVRARAAMS